MFLPENAATKRRGYNQPPMRIRSGKVALTSKTLNQNSRLKLFLRTSPRDFRRKNKREADYDIKQGCVDFGAGPRVRVHGRYPKLISAMGGTQGPAPKAMQLSQPSLLSYLQRFNKKRRIHYKIDVQPRWRSDAPSPRLKEPTKRDAELPRVC